MAEYRWPRLIVIGWIEHAKRFGVSTDVEAIPSLRERCRYRLRFRSLRCEYCGRRLWFRPVYILQDFKGPCCDKCATGTAGRLWWYVARSSARWAAREGGDDR
jgi:hypothetical protein